MISEVVKFGDCDDAHIVNVNLSGDMIAKEYRIQKEVKSVPSWQQYRWNSCEVGISKDWTIPDHPSHLWFWKQVLSVIHDQVIDSMEGNPI